MTFGGEPLLCPEAVYAIHRAAKEMTIPKREMITNGYFSRDEKKIREVAEKLADSGNVIFPDGNALKHLPEYFDSDKPVENPYADDPFDISALCVSADGSILGGNINEKKILDIMSAYVPKLQ